MAYPHDGQPPRRTANNNNNPTLWTILIWSFCWLLVATAVNMAVVVNSGGLHPSGYAKQYFSSSSSSSSSTTKMKNGHNNNNNVGGGGGVSGFNQLKFDYAAATVAAKIAENNNNNNANNHDDYELNPHLDVSLIDVDPEANLFLDEQYFQAYYSSQQLQQQQQPMKMNKNGPENGGGNHGHHQQQQQQQQNHQASKNDENTGGGGGSKFVDIRHFSLTNSASSVQLRATYGPFTSRKIINPFSVDATTTTSKTRTRNDSESDHPSSLNPNPNIRINNIHHHNPHPHPRPHKIGQSSSPSSSSYADSSNGNQNKKPHRKHNHHHPGDGGTGGGGGGIIKNISEQINAYLVTKEVRRSHPVLRVLFYASQLFELRNNRPTNIIDRLQQEKSICAVVIVQFHGERLFGTCSPSQNKLGACLAEIVIPALYWPPLDVTNGGVLAAKQQKSSLAKVFYTITHITRDQQCNDQSFLSFLAMQTTSASRSNQTDADGDGDGETISDLFTAENSMNLLHLSDVFLVPFRGSYEEVTNDNVVTVLIPQEPVYPNSKIYIPVKYTYNPEYPVSAFSLRVQVRPGLRILGAQLSHPNKLWQLSIELGPGQTSATVTAFLRDYDQNSAPPPPQQYSQSSLLPDEFLENVSQEVYSWLIEVTEDVNMNEINGRIVWQLLYETETGSYRNSIDLNVGQSLQNQPKDEHFEKESVKLTSMIDIQKDVMQEMLSITNSKELLNTAILNGRQVSRTMRIYQVSAAGRINDITFQCSCQSLDESTLKVSTSCTSVYLDGSETRGSQNATILIKYGSFIGQGNFIVWMPLLPLDIRLSDYKLSQIRGWRVHRHFRLPPMNHYGQINKVGGGGGKSASASASSSSSTSSLKRFDFVDEEMLADPAYGYRSESSFIANAFSQTCQLKFQQARVEVFTKYFSIDHDSGREATLVNRRHSIRITHIVRNLIRVSDKNVLAIRGNTIEGAGVGTANVEVISPITGAIIGSKEVEVSLDRESITKMTVHLVSGLKMDVEPFATPKHTNIWTVKTSFMNTLTKQYQEALLDARLYFSDRTSVYLSEISPADHHLSINTFKGLVDNVTRNNMEYDDDGRNDGNHHHHHHGHHGHHQSFMNEMPRIIALMPGNGEVVQMTMDVIRACQKKRSNQQQQPQPLASGYINVDVNFELPETSYSLQNDAIHYRRYGNNLVGRYYSPIINSNNNHHNHTAKTLNGGESFKEQINHDFDHRHRQDGNQQIKFQRHSLGAAAAPYPATTSTNINVSSDVSSMKFGLFGLASIIFIACFIVIIYSLITNHFNRFKQNNHLYHHSTRTITTTTTTAAATTTDVVATNRSNNNNNNKLPQQCHKPYLSCLQGKTGGGGGGDRTSVLAARDWIWISKEELENERQKLKVEKAKKNTPYEDDAHCSQMQLRAPLLPPKDYLKEERQHGRTVERCQQQQQLDTTMHITINPNETFTKRFRNPNNNINSGRQQDSRNQETVDITSMITPLNPSKTRHIPIPRRKRNHHAPLKNGSNRNNVSMNNHHDDHDDHDVPRISTPPPSIHRKITPPRKKPQTNQMDPTTTANDNQTMVDLAGVLPPPIPPHKSTAPSQPPLIRRPQKLSLHKPNHRSTIINDNDDNDDDDEQMERIDYRNMMKILNKLKETDA